MAKSNIEKERWTELTANEMAQAKAHFRCHEGVVDHPYLDSRGLVTIGIGFLIVDANACAALALEWCGEGGVLRVASEAEKRAGYARLASQSRSQLRAPRAAPYWKPWTQLRAGETWIDERLSHELNTRARACARAVGTAWLDLSDGQRLVLLDVYYATGSLSGFPSLVAAARRGDGKRMAVESIYHSGLGAGGVYRRNWSRVLSNYALCLGLEEESSATAEALCAHLGTEPLPDWLRQRAKGSSAGG
ncbi:MAG: hypothetical protein OD811_03465 [Alphaproteobacteria bacterium]